MIIYSYSRSDAYALSYFFEGSLIKNKVDIINIWLDLIRIIITVPFSLNNKGEIKIIERNNVKRVFLFRENQIVSLNFPFSLQKNDKQDTFDVYLGSILIDAKRISSIKAVINKDNYFSSSWDLDLGHLMDESRDEQEEMEIWLLLKHLIVLDDGYIRYDRDGKNHPENPNHLDIFISSTSTFKVGLDCELDLDLLLDILDRNTEAYFLRR